MRIVLTLFTTFLTSSFVVSAQSNCLVNLLSSNDLEISRSDSAWRKGLDSQINHYVTLRKDILPKYSGLREKILAIIDKKDFERLYKLKADYLNQVDNYLAETRSTNARVTKHLRPSAEISNFILFETLGAYPDTWALLVNSNVINRKINNADLAIVNLLNKKYNSKFKSLDDCIQVFKKDRELNLRIYPVPLIFQGSKTEANSSECDVIDLLLWAVL